MPPRAPAYSKRRRSNLQSTQTGSGNSIETLNSVSLLPNYCTLLVFLAAMPNIGGTRRCQELGDGGGGRLDRYHQRQQCPRYL
jgi:hypothetical protein